MLVTKRTSAAHCGRAWKVLMEQRGSFIEDKLSEVVLHPSADRVGLFLCNTFPVRFNAE